ncbi:hypothetical protein [Amycolatopsis sp. lyj-112]|uniref:hypothetical protein n=1 Tax=Amycolatopsis sp. lyj-112 TaxID=2789288 RepID=UPI00397D59B6
MVDTCLDRKIRRLMNDTSWEARVQLTKLDGPLVRNRTAGFPADADSGTHPHAVDVAEEKR